MVPILLTLLAIPSVSGNRPECTRVLQAVREMLPADAGLFFEQVESAGVVSLVVSTRPGRWSALVLSAHLDVVPAQAEQFHPRVEGSRVHGRGAYDMKGAAAVYVQLLRDVAALPAERRPDLQVQFVTDEEIGGHHGSRVLLEKGFTGDLYVAGEPTDLDVCHRAKGPLWVTVHQPGRSAHGSRPWEGQNPIVALHEGLAALLRLYPVPASAEWRTTVSPTMVAAGDAHNRIPAEATLKLDIRRVAQDPSEAVLASVRRCFPSARIEVVQDGSALDTAVAHPQVVRLARVIESVTGRPPRFFGEHFASDARYWGGQGVPAVCWGLRGSGIHGDDEWVDLESMSTYLAILHRLVGLERP